MSSSSNSINQIISLPQGRGALSGIGEKFSTDLHTGTGNGNGLFGLGWSLSVPGVSRKTSGGVLHYNDNARNLEPGERRDIFIFSAAEDLVPVALWEPDPDE